MRCLGRTNTIQRCRNETRSLFCRHHRWQPIAALISIISFLGVLAGIYQDIWKSILNKDVAIPAIHDEPYAVARSLLIREGWIPQVNHWGHGDTIDIQSGNGPDLWNKGYHELDYCSGTGYALCRFEFNDPTGNLLVILTSGESIDGNIEGVKVFRVNLNPENEVGAYGDTLGISPTSVDEVQKALRSTKNDNK